MEKAHKKHDLHKSRTENTTKQNRRLLKDKIIALKKELSGVRRHRDFQRRGRKKLGLPVVALVGYTNAGKSTLLNTLTRAGVMAENMLFATLDPTTRKVKLSGLKVGVVQCLWHGLCMCVFDFILFRSIARANS